MSDTSTTTVVGRNKMFGGWQEIHEHRSNAVGCAMRFGCYLPPRAAEAPCHVLFFLSGLTCTEQNFVTKAGAQRAASEHGIIVIAPDTSPRGDDVPDDEAADLGKGAGFYLNATEAPWAQHYRMYDYVTEELPGVVNALTQTTGRFGICGHSMGGHGALVIGLRTPERFGSISAFAPISTPSVVPWGEKAFSNYLGDDRAAWQAYDATELVAGAATDREILIDQGQDDGFLAEQLRPELFQDACKTAGQSLKLRRHAGYDHSYFFIASFIGDHIAHHARLLDAR